MIALALRLLGVASPSWLTKPVAYLVDAAIVIALLIGAYLLVYGRGETAGAAKATATTEKAHTQAVTDARHDERTAQSIADQIGASTTHSNQLATDLVRTTIEDLHHAIDVPATPAGAAPARVDTARLSASLDGLVDRANGAADSADAQP